jgi:hypothetical protein
MAELNSKYQRVHSVISDKFGIDPLKDRLIPLINRIQSYETHQVQQDERGAPDLISERRYGSDEFWWIILAYNGISSYRTIVEGIILKIPNISTVVSIVTENSIRPSSVKRVITI